MNGKKIDLTADEITIESDNFKVDKNGKVTATSGTIGGYDITKDNFSAELYTDYDYEEADLEKIKKYLMGEITLSDKELERLDYYKDGKIDAKDYMFIKNAILANISNTKRGHILIQRKDPFNTIVLKDGDDNVRARIGVDGIYLKETYAEVTSEKEIFSGRLYSQEYLNEDFSKYRRLLITVCMYARSESDDTGGSSNVCILDLSDTPAYGNHIAQILCPYITNNGTVVSNVANNSMIARILVNEKKDTLYVNFFYLGLLDSSNSGYDCYYISRIVGIL